VPEHAAALMLQFLAWVAARPRTYAETMAAWRTSCPRLAIWEDATAEGLVEVASGGAPSQGQAGVVLTAEGEARLRVEMAAKEEDAEWTGPHANT
jgi:hypothetical protein